MSANKMQITIKSATIAVALLLALVGYVCEAKIMARSRYYDQPGMYDSPYMSGATGERALITVRGARHPYDGSAPSKLMIEDQPYQRGPYPRGVYDRLDGYGGRGMRPGHGMGYGMGYGMGSLLDGGYGYPYRPMGGRYGPMADAPSRIAVTGAFPYGYGSRYMP